MFTFVFAFFPTFNDCIPKVDIKSFYVQLNRLIASVTSTFHHLSHCECLECIQLMAIDDDRYPDMLNRTTSKHQ